jgi:hypothetical protein
MSEENAIKDTSIDINEPPVSFVRNEDGKMVMTEEGKAWSSRLYYQCRLAYSNDDRRFPIGRYNDLGEVIPFERWQKSRQV